LTDYEQYLKRDIRRLHLANKQALNLPLSVNIVTHIMFYNIDDDDGVSRQNDV